jgi:hypothetical protein
MMQTNNVPTLNTILNFLTSLSSSILLDNNVQVTADTINNTPMICIIYLPESFIFSPSKEIELTTIEAIVHTHKALLTVGIISIRPLHSSLTTMLAPSE